MELSSFKYKWVNSLVNTLNYIMWNNEWKKGEDYPSWGNTDVYKKTISGGYLLDGETPRAVSYTHLTLPTILLV